MGTASGTFHSWSCFALLNHLLLTQAMHSVVCTGKEQDLLLRVPTSPVRAVFTSSCGESLCFMGMTLTLNSDPKEPASSSTRGKEQWLNGTGRKNELIAHSKFLSACGGVMSSTSGDFHKNGSWFPASKRTPLGPMAQQSHLPQAWMYLLVRTRFARHSQHPRSLSNLLVWEKRCSPIPMLPQQSEFVFPSWSREHPTAWAQRNNFLYVFHWNSIIFLMAWGHLKFSSCAVEVFSTKAGVLTMVAWHSSSSARTTRLSRCSGSRGSAPRTV